MPCMGAVAAVLLAALQGYVFREADGGPPRRPMTVELLREGRPVHRGTTQANGAFEFAKVREGEYTLRARFNDFAVAEESVRVAGAGTNFHALMLPKRRSGTGQTFGTVSYEQLTARSDRAHQKTLRKAGALARKRDFAGAARLFEQALAKHPSAEVYDTLALIYLHLGRKEDAFQAWENALARDPKYLLPYAHLAMVYFEDRRFRELLEVANRALETDRYWLTAHLYAAEAQAGLGNGAAALRSAEIASKLARGRAPGPHLLLARLHWELRDCARAA